MTKEKYAEVIEFYKNNLNMSVEEFVLKLRELGVKITCDADKSGLPVFRTLH